jgi:hypothetical protein
MPVLLVANKSSQQEQLGSGDMCLVHFTYSAAAIRHTLAADVINQVHSCLPCATVL